MNETFFLYGPLAVLILCYILGLFFYTTYIKSHQGIGIENKNVYLKREVIIFTTLAFMTGITKVIYSYIGYDYIENTPVINVIDQNQIYIFLGLIYVSLLLNILIFYGVLKYMSKAKINKFQKLISISILGFAMAEFPSILGLVLLFSYINKIS